MRIPALLVLACLWAVPGLAADDAAEGFELILLDGYEDCPLAFRDADLDGFGGDTDVRITCAPPAGFVTTGGDCDDANAAINPAAAETEPDAQFLDQNCDGVDGNAALAIFVTTTGSAAANCGTRSLPCTLGVAFNRALTAGRTQVYLQRGDYPIALRLEVVAGTLAIFGGYDVSWRRANRTTNPSRILGAAVANIGAFGVQAAGGTYRLVDLLVAAPTTTQRTLNGDGLGSYGVRAVSSAILTLTRVTITAGTGADGLDGTNGSSASQVAAAAGGSGGDGVEEFGVVCDESTRGLGGPGGLNAQCGSGSRPSGGSGGNGGTQDTDCDFPFNFTARPGIAGLDAFAPVGANGQGGAGGSGGDACGATVNGTIGTITDGIGGFVSTNARGTAPAAGLNSIWIGNAGSAGTVGLDGTGGGGGGGAGGCDVGTDSYGAGGGGGGAGGCRASDSGDGGRGGGGSFGVFVSGSVLSIQDTQVVRSSGGSGGDGGSGGLGQPAGAAGPVGLHPGGAIGGLGGAGGRGGHSGAGSGGGGGISVGIFSFQSTVNTGAGVTHAGGAAGPGGTGGNIGVPGADGPNGSNQSTFTCVAASGC